MEDGEGRVIDFKNTIILLTTNAGSELIMNMCKDPELMPDAEGIAKALREPLLKVFPPALLGRLVVIPYYPLSDEMIRNISPLQLRRIEKRVADEPQGAVHLRRRRAEADRQPLHRTRERRPHDRRDPDQHRSCRASAE
jgi:ATP-dependent Clp protease ATP-binding subunit ClpA